MMSFGCRVSADAKRDASRRRIDCLIATSRRTIADLRRTVSSEDRAPAEDALRLSAEGLRLIVDTIPGLVDGPFRRRRARARQSSRPGLLRKDVRGVEGLGYK